MICLLLTIIMLVLRLCGVLDWSLWVVYSPLLAEGILATWLLIKTEFEYMREYNRKPKEETEE